MAHHILRLKLLLLANSFRRSPWQLAGMGLALLYGLGTAVLVVAGLFALRFVDIEVARSAEVVFGAVIVVLFAVLPLMLGLDDTLDPRRFALYGMSNTRLAFGLGLASFISIPAIVITIIALALIVTWSRTPLSIGLAVASAVIIVVTCVLTARVSTSVATLLVSHGGRLATALVGSVAVIACLVPVAAVLTSVDWGGDVLAIFTTIERVVSWTPLGAAWAIPADAAAGDTDGAIWKIVIAVAWILELMLAWRLLIGVTLVTPVRETVRRRYPGLGWFDRLPAIPAGVIAARNLTYWSRDARYAVSLWIIPVVPIVMIVALAIGGLPVTWLALIPVPVMSLFLAWAVHNDVAFDNTAIWLHLATSTSGRNDRWGRLIPVLLVGVPLVVVGSVISVWVLGDWIVLPALIGVSACILLSGLGLSSIMSAAFPYPTVRPGESPFSQPSGSGGPAGLIQALSFGAIVVLTAPSVFFAFLGFTQSPMWFAWSLFVGVGVGLVVIIVGVTVGSRVFDHRGPELLAAATRN